MSSLESTSQHVARRLELITNWLALSALLGIGIVWGPSADEGTRMPEPPGASLHARVDSPRPTPPSARSHQAQSSPAQVPRRG